MPTYEYQCVACDNRFERFQRMSDPAVTDCPRCDGRVRKVLHAPAISFKGPGFYVNDYKKSTVTPDPSNEAIETPKPTEAPSVPAPATAPIAA